MLGELLMETVQVCAIVRLVPEGPGNLDQTCSEAVGGRQQLNPILEHALVIGSRVPPVGKSLPQFRRKTEVGPARNAIDPCFRRRWPRRTVKGAVDLDGV